MSDTRGGHSRRRAPAASAGSTAGRGARETERFVHAGSCNARALASAESVTPSISSTMRCTLFSGCCS